MGKHSSVNLGSRHPPHNWTFADATVREAATGPPTDPTRNWETRDLAGWAFQQDNNTFWMLLSISPVTWVQINPQDPENVTSLKLPVRKATAGTILKGYPVYVVGYDSGAGVSLVELADASSIATMPAAALAEGNFTDAISGFGLYIGPIPNLDTSAFPIGTILFVPDSPGPLTEIPPTGAGSFVQPLGLVIEQHASTGIIGATASPIFTNPNMTENNIWIGNAGNGIPIERPWAHAHTSAAEGGVLSGSAISVAQSKIFYVGLHGNDGNAGTALETAFRTFGAAIVAAIAETPTAINAFVIRCLDAGLYVENLTVPSFVRIEAPSATIQGNHLLSDNSGIVIGSLITNTGAAVSKTAGSGSALIKANVIQLLLSANGVVCTSGSLFVDANAISLADGQGIGGSTSEKIYANVCLILINGTGDGIGISGGGTIDLNCCSIDSVSGTAINVAAASFVRANIQQINCATAYDVAGELRLVAGFISGTRTVTGTVKLTEAGEQLLRGAGDFQLFATKADPVAADTILVEDSAASNAKVKVLLNTLLSGITSFKAKKASVGTVLKGKAVYITGYDSGDDSVLVEPARADAAGTMPAIGVLQEDITEATRGDCVVSGEVNTLDTSAWSVGDDLYVSASSPGILTDTRPVGAGSLIQKLAEVIVDDPALGRLMIFGAGRPNELPNLSQNKFWRGDADAIPQESSSVAGFTGVLGTPQTPAAHAAVHEDGGGDLITIEDLTTAETDTGLRLAPAGGGAVQWSPPGLTPRQTYLSGEYYDARSAGFCIDVFSTQVLSTGSIYFGPFFVDVGHTFTRMSLEKTSGAGTGINARIGIYTDVGNRPDSLIIDPGEIVNFDVNGVYELTMSQLLTPGKYWFATMTSGGRTVRSHAVVEGRTIGYATAADIGQNVSLLGTQGYGPMPATAPAAALSTLKPPRISLRA